MPEAGWYPDGRTPGTVRWWDGSQWTEQVRTATAPSAGQDGLVMTFTGKVNGTRNRVSIYDDRIELVKSTGVSAGKITAGILTGGLSLAVTGVGKGSYASGKVLGVDVIRLDTVTGVTSRKDGNHWDVVVTTSTMRMSMVVDEDEVQRIVWILNDCVAKARRPQGASRRAEEPPRPLTSSVVVNIEGSTGPSDAATVQAAQIAALSSPDLTANLERIADLRFQRLITDEEFAAMKAKLLGSYGADETRPDSR